MDDSKVDEKKDQSIENDTTEKTAAQTITNADGDKEVSMLLDYAKAKSTSSH